MIRRDVLEQATDRAVQHAKVSFSVYLYAPGRVGGPGERPRSAAPRRRGSERDAARVASLSYV